VITTVFIPLPTNPNIQNGYPAQPPLETSRQLTYSNRMIDDPVDEAVQGWGKDAQFDANKYGSHHISHPLKPQRGANFVSLTN
jgi:hypothetical protein